MSQLFKGVSLLWLVIIVMLGAPILTIADEALRERFVRELKKTNRAPQEVNLRVRTYIKSEVSDAAIEADSSPGYLAKLKQRGEDPKKQQRKSELAYFDNCIMQKRYEKGGLTVKCKNEHYAFAIYKAKGAKSFVLIYAGQLGSDPRIDKIIKKETEKSQRWFTGPWYVGGEYFPDLISKPGFEFLDIKEIEKEGRKLVRADFEYLVEENERYNPSLYDAYVICDPALRWAIVEKSVTRKNSKINSEIRLTTTIDNIKLYHGIPLGDRIISETQWIHKNGEIDLIIYNREISEDVSKEEFYLSHYGLPEPTLKTRWYSSWFFYLLVVLICVGLGYWTSRRRAVAT